MGTYDDLYDEEWEIDFEKGGPGSGRRKNPDGTKQPYRGGRTKSDAATQYLRHDVRPGTENWTAQQHVAEAASDVKKAEELIARSEFGRAQKVMEEARYHASAAAHKNPGIGKNHPNFSKMSQMVHNRFEDLYEKCQSAVTSCRAASKASKDVTRAVSMGDHTSAVQLQAIAGEAMMTAQHDLEGAILAVRGLDRINGMLQTRGVGERITSPRASAFAVQAV